ncbi:transcriptional activator of glycolytic enzymes-domain-containing protein [Xylariaceae sp. FL0594]|nr:transcriptional activator of glycolytic enzymes-domain-containing protein [Xylariaceae sp. FL0594]
MVPHPLSSQVSTSIATLPTTASIPITTTATATAVTSSTNTNTSVYTPTSTPTTPTSSTSTATPTPATPALCVAAPATNTGGPVLKRKASSELDRITSTTATPSAKRQATASRDYNVAFDPGPDPSTFETPLASQPQQVPQRPQGPQQNPCLPQHLPASMLPANPALVSEDQLHGRTPEQLIATILQLQSQQQQFVSQINAQYEHINQQLQDLRGSLIASHHAAASALGTREQPFRSVVPPPPGPPQQTAIPPPPRPAVQTPVQIQTPGRATSRLPPASPGHHVVPRTSISGSTSTAAVPPQYDYRTVATVEEVWKEYREGIDGQPAIEKLDATWGSRWRPEPRGRTWYSRRKVIWDKIKEFINEGMDENQAVQEVEKLREGGTINKLIRMLQDERKDRGIADDAVVG